MSNTQPINQLSRIETLKKQGDIDGLEALLKVETDKTIRENAIYALMQISEPEAYTILGELLHEEHSHLLDDIAAHLAEKQGNAALLALANGLSSADIFTRSTTIKFLAKREESSVLTYLVRVCRDPQQSISKLGNRLLLRRIKTHSQQLEGMRPEALAGIMAELKMEEVWKFLPETISEKVRHAAISRMGYFSSKHAVEFLITTAFEAPAPACDLALEAIKQNKSVTAHDLRTILASGRLELFSRAFNCFAERTDPDGVELLTECLDHPDPEIRKPAVEALFRLFGSQIVPLLIPHLSDENPEVCHAVLDAIATAPRQMVEKPLVITATEGPAEIRALALPLAAAKGICAPELIQGYLTLLSELLEDPRPEGKKLNDICHLIDLLSEIRPVVLLVSLIKAARSPSPRLRRVAMKAFSKYPLHQRIEAFLYLLHANDTSIVTEVAFCLAEANRPEAKVPLIRVAMGKKRKNAYKAHKVLSKMPEMRDIEELCRLVCNKYPVVKQYGIDRLKEMGDPRAVAMLLQAIEEGNEELQQKALARLSELGNQDVQKLTESDNMDISSLDISSMQDLGEQADPRAIDMLLQASEDEDELVQLSAVDALGKFCEDERVVKRLIDFIGYGSVPVRQKAVEILGDEKIQDSVDALISALGNIFLRSYAEEALRKIGDRRGYLAVIRRRKREKMFPSRAKMERERIKQQRLTKKDKVNV